VSMFKRVFSVMCVLTVVTTMPMSAAVMSMVFVHSFKELMYRGITALVMLETRLLNFFFEIQERLKGFQSGSELLFIPFE